MAYQSDRQHVVLGAGAVGLILAGTLARVGIPVRLIVREARLAAYPGSISIKRRGRALEAIPVRASAILDGPTDVLWIAVKSPDLPDALAEIATDIGRESVVVPLLNGVDHLQLLTQRFGARVHAGSIRIDARRISAFAAEQCSVFSVIELATNGRESAVAAVVRDLRRAGVGTSIAEDDLTVLWRKLVLLAPFALGTAAVGGSVGSAKRDIRISALMQASAAETCAVAAAEGVRIDEHAAVRQLLDIPDEMESSLKRDVCEGRCGELSAICEPIVQRGRFHAVATTATELLRDAVMARLNPARLE